MGTLGKRSMTQARPQRRMGRYTLALSLRCWLIVVPRGRLVLANWPKFACTPGFLRLIRQPQSYAAYQRQRAAWEAADCRVFARPLRYPKDWPNSRAEQKGVDTALAVDLVFGSARRFYDLAIVASTDTDLVPALEAVSDMQRAWGTPRIEVASWSPTRKRLRVDGARIWCHWLSEDDYTAVRDETNYTLST
jgi:hypothetical protein